MPKEKETIEAMVASVTISMYQLPSPIVVKAPVEKVPAIAEEKPEPEPIVLPPAT